MSIRAADEKTELLLLDYLDGTLDAAKKAELEAYLASHPRERQVLDDLRTQRDRLAAVPMEKAPVEILEAAQGQLERAALLDHFSDPAPIVAGRRAGPQWLSLAAVFVLATGLAGALYFVLAPKGPPTDLALAAKTAPSGESAVVEAAPASPGGALAVSGLPDAAPGAEALRARSEVRDAVPTMETREVVILTSEPESARLQVEQVLRAGGWTFAEWTTDEQGNLRLKSGESGDRDVVARRGDQLPPVGDLPAAASRLLTEREAVPSTLPGSEPAVRRAMQDVAVGPGSVLPVLVVRVEQERVEALAATLTRIGQGEVAMQNTLQSLSQGQMSVPQGQLSNSLSNVPAGPQVGAQVRDAGDELRNRASAPPATSLPTTSSGYPDRAASTRNRSDDRQQAGSVRLLVRFERMGVAGSGEFGRVMGPEGDGSGIVPSSQPAEPTTMPSPATAPATQPR